MGEELCSRRCIAVSADMESLLVSGYAPETKCELFAQTVVTILHIAKHINK